MEIAEMSYKEVYGNGKGLLEVSVHTGRLNMFAARNAKTGECKHFTTLKDLESYIYNNGYHIAATNRSTMFARYILEDITPLALMELTTRKDGTQKEICFPCENSIYTGWVIGENLCDKREVIVRCNCPGAYTNCAGYKTVTVPVENIIVLSDY